MPSNHKGRKQRKSHRRAPRKRPDGRTSITEIVMYTKNITFQKFYDNNGVDEQGLRCTLPLSQVLPANSSSFGNDYNRSSVLKKLKLSCRWAAGYSNPPVAFQLYFISADKQSWAGPSRKLNNVNFTSLIAVPPLHLKAYIIDNPSSETALQFEIRFFGMDMVAADMPTMFFEVTLHSECVPVIAHSGV